MNVHGPAVKFHTKLTRRKVLSDTAFREHCAFKYYLSMEHSNRQCRIGGQGGCALSSSLLYLCRRLWGILANLLVTMASLLIQYTANLLVTMATKRI